VSDSEKQHEAALASAMEPSPLESSRTESRLGARDRTTALPPKKSFISALVAAVPVEVRPIRFFARTQQTNRQYAMATGGGGGLLFRSFVLMVLAPTVVALGYFALVASDVFVSEAKLTVREAVQSTTSDRNVTSVLGQLDLGKTGDNAQNSMIVMDYIKSRAVVADVGGRDKLLQVYGTGGIDFLSRLEPTDDLERIWQYWRDHVTASVDTLSGILTLRIRAYTPDDALSLSSEVIQKSEALINAISVRSKEDSLRRAKDEVNLASGMLADARASLLEFQQSSQTIDPTETAKQTLKLISSLTLQKTAIESELATSASLGTINKPGEAQLRARLGAVKNQIEKLNATLTGKDTDVTVSTQLRDFELLKIQEEFAEYMYKLARTSFERARQNLEKQDLYLAVVVPPSRPDSATYPRTFSYTALTFAGLVIAWGIMSLLVASIKDSIT
jgi:capsular polysaccharide transport system permease protein